MTKEEFSKLQYDEWIYCGDTVGRVVSIANIAKPADNTKFLENSDQCEPLQVTRKIQVELLSLYNDNIFIESSECEKWNLLTPDSTVEARLKLLEYLFYKLEMFVYGRLR